LFLLAVEFIVTQKFTQTCSNSKL